MLTPKQPPYKSELMINSSLSMSKLYKWGPIIAGNAVSLWEQDTTVNEGPCGRNMTTLTARGAGACTLLTHSSTRMDLDSVCWQYLADRGVHTDIQIKGDTVGTGIAPSNASHSPENYKFSLLPGICLIYSLHLNVTHGFLFYSVSM